MLIAGALVFSGCVTREDIRGIQTDLYNIQNSVEKRLGNVKEQTDVVQTSQADLFQEIQQLNSNLSALKTELADSRQRMDQLSMRLDDLEVSLTARMDSQIELLSGSKFVAKPLPSTVFNLANTDFARGKYAEAKKGFENYIKQFPKGERVPEARLKIGDSLLKQKETEAAAQAYDELIVEFPKDSLVPTAMLRKANAFDALGRLDQAREVYNAIVRTYPHTSEAKAAQDKLRSSAN